MSSLFARETAIVPITATATLAGKEGFFYKLDGSNQAVAIAAVTDVPDGLIGAVTSDGLEISALKAGGNHGTVKVKLGANVTNLTKDLVLRADGSVGPDTGAGARVIVARPVETGSSTEMIEAILMKPRVFGAAVTALATADGSDAGTTQALANATKAKLNAVIAALQTSGHLA
jgi:hypothetical protein